MESQEPFQHRHLGHFIISVAPDGYNTVVKYLHILPSNAYSGAAVSCRENLKDSTAAVWGGGVEPMRSGLRGAFPPQHPSLHVSAFLPAHIRFSTNWGNHPIAHKGAQAFSKLSVGGNSSSCQLSSHFHHGCPDTHIPSQVARCPPGLLDAYF